MTKDWKFKKIHKKQIQEERQREKRKIKLILLEINGILFLDQLQLIIWYGIHLSVSYPPDYKDKDIIKVLHTSNPTKFLLFVILHVNEKLTDLMKESQNLCNRLYYCLWVCQFPNSQTSSSPSWTDWELLHYTKIMLLSINMPQVSLLQYVWIQKPFHWKSVFPMCK